MLFVFGCSNPPEPSFKCNGLHHSRQARVLKRLVETLTKCKSLQPSRQIRLLKRLVERISTCKSLQPNEALHCDGRLGACNTMCIEIYMKFSTGSTLAQA